MNIGYGVRDDGAQFESPPGSASKTERLPSRITSSEEYVCHGVQNSSAQPYQPFEAKGSEKWLVSSTGPAFWTSHEAESYVSI